MTNQQLLAIGGAAVVSAGLVALSVWPSDPDACREVEIAVLSDAGVGYALATLRGPAPDAGDEVPGAIAVLDVRDIACPEGSEPMSLAVEPIQWPCGCRRADDSAGACEALGMGDVWAPAPMGAALQPGQWRGACARTPCIEVAGVPSFAAECR